MKSKYLYILFTALFFRLFLFSEVANAVDPVHDYHYYTFKQDLIKYDKKSKICSIVLSLWWVTDEDGNVKTSIFDALEKGPVSEGQNKSWSIVYFPNRKDPSEARWEIYAVGIDEFIPESAVLSKIGNDDVSPKSYERAVDALRQYQKLIKKGYQKIKPGTATHIRQHYSLPEKSFDFKPDEYPDTADTAGLLGDNDSCTIL